MWIPKWRKSEQVHVFPGVNQNFAFNVLQKRSDGKRSLSKLRYYVCFFTNLTYDTDSWHVKLRLRRFFNIPKYCSQIKACYLQSCPRHYFRFKPSFIKFTNTYNVYSKYGGEILNLAVNLGLNKIVWFWKHI